VTERRTGARARAAAGAGGASGGSPGPRRGPPGSGPDERSWGRFQAGVFEDPTTRFMRLAPATLRARDLSYVPG